MFEVGFTEIVLILGLALLVLGPEKLPGLAEKVGRWTGRARAMARQLRTQLEHEVTIEELSKSRASHAPHAGGAHGPGDEVNDAQAGASAPYADVPAHEPMPDIEPDASPGGSAAPAEPATSTAKPAQ